MKLTAPDIPALLNEAFQVALAAGIPQGLLREIDSFVDAKLIHSLPLYVLPFPALAEGKVAASARRAGWACLARDSKGNALSGDAASSDPSLCSRSIGPLAEKLLEVYEQLLAEAPNLADGDYEARLLQIPGPLYRIDVFWLRKMPGRVGEEQPEQDYVAVFGGFRNNLGGRLIVSMGEFLAYAAPYARRRLERGSPPD